MTTDLIARQAIIAKTHEVIALARRLYPDYTAPTPTISFDLRGRSVGGTARGSYHLTFNLDWYNADPVKYLANTVPHEVAHIVASATGRGEGHNMGWKRIDRSLGGTGERCATHDGTKVERARSATEYLYINSFGREVWVGPVHHKRMQQYGRDSKNMTNAGLPYLRKYELKDRTGARITWDKYQGKSRDRA